MKGIVLCIAVFICLNIDLSAGQAQDPEGNTFFHLFTRSNPTNGHLIVPGSTEFVKNSPFDASKPIRYIIHGRHLSHNVPAYYIIKDAYLEAGDYNVIMMDYGKLVFTLQGAVKLSRGLGKILAEHLDDLKTASGVKLEDITIVGHSTGAHVAGFAGKLVKSGRIGVIVGLDPAMADANVPEERLAIGDALYVQGIHTEAGIMGYNGPIGDASFFPNYGTWQPGCFWVPGCSHMLAPVYFAESVSPSMPHFLSTECQSYDNIKASKCVAKSNEKIAMGGEPIQTKTKGIYHLETNYWSPYAKGN